MAWYGLKLKENVFIDTFMQTSKFQEQIEETKNSEDREDILLDDESLPIL